MTNKLAVKLNLSVTANNILTQKKQLTGVSKSKLVEFAVINMPYVPPKKIKEVLL